MRALACFVCLAACDNASDNDAPVDLSVPASQMDLSVQADAKAVTPFNMPGKIECYTGPLCSAGSAEPVCCDANTDGGFSDTCVASAGVCLGMDSKARTFECGQAADCGAGMICCGDIGKASSGKSFFTATTCAATCSGTQTQLCVSAAECKSGSQCAGQTISGRDVGLCQ